MENTKMIVARKIHELRAAQDMTQIDLAKRLNYSDKAISKWERGESLPDAAVLVQLAELFGVTLDELVRDRRPPEPEPAQEDPDRKVQHALILGMSLLLVLFLATLAFVVLVLTGTAKHFWWLCFVWAVPIILIVWLVLNSVWFNRRRNYAIISLLMWSVLGTLYLSLLPFGLNIWLIFLLGIPGQIIIFLWSGLHRKK